jgi:hypothetical protein
MQRLFIKTDEIFQNEEHLALVTLGLTPGLLLRGALCQGIGTSA